MTLAEPAYCPVTAADLQKSLDYFEKASHFPVPFSMDAARAAETALAEHYAVYKPSIQANADFLTKQDQEDQVDEVLNNPHVSQNADLKIDLSFVKEVEDKKNGLLEKRISLSKGLRAEGDPAKRDEIRKQILSVDGEVAWLNQGIVELVGFEQNLQVTSLSHTTLRLRTRSKFLHGYLNHDEKEVEQARNELFILFRAQELELVQAGIFPAFIAEYPAHFVFRVCWTTLPM